MEFLLKYVPEFVPWGHEFGNIFYKVCLSIISSYVFYFIVVHIKDVKDKDNIGLFVSRKVRNILRDYKSQILELKKAANNTDNDIYLKKTEIESIFSTINPKSKAPLLRGQPVKYANWIQYLNYYNSRTQGFIQKVFVIMPFLETRLISLLSKIDDCTHFMCIGTTANIKFNNTEMSSWASGFYEYSTLCKELEQYYKKHLVQYK